MKNKIEKIVTSCTNAKELSAAMEHINNACSSGSITKIEAAYWLGVTAGIVMTAKTTEALEEE